MTDSLNLSLEQLMLLVYQHAAQLQVANPALRSERALARAQDLAVRAFNETLMREGLKHAAEQAGISDELARSLNLEAGATLALSDEASSGTASKKSAI